MHINLQKDNILNTYPNTAAINTYVTSFTWEMNVACSLSAGRLQIWIRIATSYWCWRRVCSRRITLIRMTRLIRDVSTEVKLSQIALNRKQRDLCTCIFKYGDLNCFLLQDAKAAIKWLIRYLRYTITMFELHIRSICLIFALQHTKLLRWMRWPVFWRQLQSIRLRHSEATIDYFMNYSVEAQSLCLNDNVKRNAAIATPIVVVAAAVAAVIGTLVGIKLVKIKKINKLNAIPRTAREMVEIMDFEEPAKHIHDRVQWY